MALKIVFLEEYSVNESDLSSIRRLGDYTGYDNTTDRQIIERCKGADVVITNKTPMTADTIAALVPELKLICVAATGMNNIDLKAAAEAGVEVRNAVGYSTDSVAELTFCGVLALYRQLLYYDNYVKSGAYVDAPRLFDFGRPTYELKGKKWGIVGLGNIGRRVAALATAFGCEVGYYSTSGSNQSTDYRRMELDAMLEWADIVSVHAPLSRQTYHLINRERLSLMKPTAIVVNVARGSLVDEQALADALNEGIIAGAATDVYSAEPMQADNPLLTVRDKLKLVLTPHTAFATKEALQRLVECVADNIREFSAENCREQSQR